MKDMVYLTEDHPRILSLVTHPRWQVIFAILSLCAIILFDSFFYIFRPYDGIGVYQEAPLGEVYEVDPSGPADKAGVLVGDQILAINGKPINPLIHEPRYRPVSWLLVSSASYFGVSKVNFARLETFSFHNDVFERLLSGK